MKKINKQFKTDIGQQSYIRNHLERELLEHDVIKFDVLFEKQDGSKRIMFAEIDAELFNASKDFGRLLVRDKMIKGDHNIRTITLDMVEHLQIYSNVSNSNILSINFEA